jgi:hypothetical protein
LHTVVDARERLPLFVAEATFVPQGRKFMAHGGDDQPETLQFRQFQAVHLLFQLTINKLLVKIWLYSGLLSSSTI